MAWDWQVSDFDSSPWDASTYTSDNYVDSQYDPNLYNDSFTFDDSWDDSFDSEFFPETSFNASPGSNEQFPTYDVGQALPTLSPEMEALTTEQPSSSNEWFSGLKDFAKTDLGGRVISGGITGLGSFITNAMNQSAQDRRMEDERKFQERQAALNREHQLALAKMKGGGGGGAGPASTQATTSSLDQNIIKAR